MKHVLVSTLLALTLVIPLQIFSQNQHAAGNQSLLMQNQALSAVDALLGEQRPYYYYHFMPNSTSINGQQATAVLNIGHSSEQAQQLSLQLNLNDGAWSLTELSIQTLLHFLHPDINETTTIDGILLPKEEMIVQSDISFSAFDEASSDVNQFSRSFPQQVLNLVNSERAKAGLLPLSQQSQLVSAAQGHTDNMAHNGFFSHTDPQGLGPSDRILAAGYRFRRAAENIAAGYNTPASVVKGWMSSPGHRRNILDPNLKEIGIGYIHQPGSPYSHYWTQNFGSR